MIASPAFTRAVEFVLAREGGMTDDHRDKGGLTRWGISQAAYPGVDIANLTRDGAVTIYKRDYWDIMRCGEMPDRVGILVFDCAVNQGCRAAAKMIQAAVGAQVDGFVGTETIAAIQKAGPSVAPEMTARRMVAYATHPQFDIYGLGWSRRLAACLYEAVLAP